MKKIIKEELTNNDIKTVKELIKTALYKLFYTLYVKKKFWSE